ncbi:hypothetical protein S245_070977, partial [Arachis hypogaea]
AWERMPWLKPIPRHQLTPTEIPVARRWSHYSRTRKWLSMTQANIRNTIDFMEEMSMGFEFVWRSYVGIIIPVELHAHLE